MIQLKSLFHSLNNYNVRYLLCGGMAVNLYGIPRMTADVDLLIEWDAENVNSFEKAIGENGYKPSVVFQLKNLISSEVRINMRRDKNLIAYSFSSDSIRTFSLDVVIDLPLDFKVCWERREVRRFSDVDVNLLSVNDLICMKELANREQDKIDVVNLKQFFKK